MRALLALVSFAACAPTAVVTTDTLPARTPPTEQASVRGPVRAELPPEVLEAISAAAPDAEMRSFVRDADGGLVDLVIAGTLLRVRYRAAAERAYVEHGLDDAVAAIGRLHALRDAGVVLSRMDRTLFATHDDERIACLRTASDPIEVRCYRAPESVEAVEWARAEARGEITWRDRNGSLVQGDFVRTADALRVRARWIQPLPRPSILEAPSWTLPPSARRSGAHEQPRRRARGGESVWAAVDSPIAAIVAQGATVPLVLELGADARAILFRASDEDGSGAILCVARADAEMSCALSPLEELVGLAASSAPNVWLVVAESSHGNMRDNARLAILLSIEDGALAVDELDLGGVGGDGEACPNDDSYCVWMEGVGHSLRIAGPDCLERVRGVAWGAVHVRVGDRWDDEETRPPEACVDRYRIDRGRFERESCGPPDRALCAQDVQAGEN